MSDPVRGVPPTRPGDAGRTRSARSSDADGGRPVETRSPVRENTPVVNAAVITRPGAGQRLVRELQRLRVLVQRLEPVPQEIPLGYDVLFVEPVPDLAARLPWLPGTPGSALVVVQPEGAPLEVRILKTAAPDAVLHEPVTANAVLGALTVARNNFAYQKRLRVRIEKLDENLRTIRAVERAKGVLMETRNLSEDEAYQFLRSTAMQRRTSVGALAAVIIDSKELLG